MKKNLYIALAMVIGLLASCGAEDVIDTAANGNKVAVQLGGSIGISTRAVDATWTANDKIGVYMVGENQTLEDGNIVEGASNVSYVTSDGDGKFSPFDADKTIYLPVDGKVDFYAYYPYKMEVNNYRLPIDVSNQSNQEAIDLMYATVMQQDKNHPNVQLQFKHILSKIVFDVQPGAGLTASDLEKMTITIKDVDNKATFNLTDGLVSGEEIPEGVKMFKNGTTYEAILLPTASTSREVEFNLNNDKDAPFVWAMQGALVGGKKYHYTKVTVTRTDAKVSGTITDWTPVTDDAEHVAK